MAHTPRLLLAIFVCLWGFSLLQPASSTCVVVPDPNNPARYYDLNPLANPEADYKCVNTNLPSHSFFINACRPLHTVNNVCPGGTGICEMSASMTYRIGLPLETFVVASEGHLLGIFESGSWCYSGRIEFYCNRTAGAGNPVYVNDDGCYYLFRWETEHACPREGADPIPPPPAPALDTFDEVLGHLKTGGGVRAVYDAGHCVGGAGSVSGSTITSFEYLPDGSGTGRGGAITSTETSLTQQEAGFVYKVVVTEIFESQEVDVTTSYVEMATGVILEEGKVTCKFGEGVDGASFFALDC